ncbi:cell division protein FtsQ/DivIB [Pleomorphovibrio marinus]|uniref:cell division protein FtsQ/DivIB n=1 Tax=Pleomorphovibrio marinus TaxID=2164132 RepID=UPI000E0B37A8|nr:cell division protein [Pleomorphovibrio marinus]
MENRRKVKKSIVFVLLALVFLVYIGFTEHQSEQKPFAGLEIYVEAVSEVYFVEEKDLLAKIQQAFPELQPGHPLNSVSLHEIEKQILNHPYVKSADVFTDLKGKIIVKASQHIPIARVVRSLAADAYISTEGKILPTRSNYTSRVITLEGKGAEKLLEKEELGEPQRELLELLTYIRNHKFWNAQISGMEILGDGNIVMHQQVGKQLIEFGKPDQIEEKFNKINLYYQNIVPQKGWNAYERVNVKFKDQIICE